MEPKLTNTKGLKTYLNTRKSSKSPNAVISKHSNNEPLTTKDAVRFLLQGTLKWRVCRFCLITTTNLSELDEILEVGSSGAIYQVTIRDMIATFYPFQMVDDPNFPNKICNKCLDRTINSYLFTQQCERAERALLNCFNDINEKFDKLDPVERVKRRGRQKLNPNHNVLHADFQNVMSYADPVINIINVGAAREENAQTGASEFECPKCWQVLPNLESYANHEKIHPKSMWYNCRHCGKSFVKRSQYKKHMKQCQIARMVLPEPDIKKREFKCTECATFTEDFGKHLQHMEKHKFKIILEHLIERRMNELCGVCMGQGERMVELSETFHLHAGYPELTGEKTLARVLRETIPEIHKYKELNLAKRADLIMVTKRYVNTLISTSDWKTIHLKTHNTHSNNSEILQKSIENEILFFFPKLMMFLECFLLNDETNATDLDSATKSVNNEELVNNQSSDINRRNSKSQWINIETSNKRLCKICWIFKDAQCKTCIEKTTCAIEIKKSNTNYRQVKNCNMCWIFAKVGKCNFCKNITEQDNSVEMKDIDFKLKEKIEKRKRYLNNDPETIEIKSKWPRRIYFTSKNTTASVVLM